MNLTNKIFIALLFGAILGIVFNNISLANKDIILDILDVPGKLFISSLKMLVVPVVFFSIVCGVSNLGNISSLGKIGGKSLFFYMLTTCIAITLALIFSSIINPGMVAESQEEVSYIQKEGPSIKEVIINIVPENPFKAFAEANMLQIIFFAVIFGIALNMITEGKNKLKEAFKTFNDLFLKIVEIVMYFAPFGVFFLIFKTFFLQGLEAIMDLGAYFFTVLLVLFLQRLFEYS